MNLNEYVE